MEDTYYNEFLKLQEEKKATDAAENIKAFLSDNKPFCDRALVYYNAYKTNVNKYVSRPHRVSADSFKNYLKPTNILVLTANPIEKGVFLHWMSDKMNAPLETLQINYHYYNIGYIDENLIVHANTGKTGEEYTRRALNNVRKIFTPDYMFMLGICYGLADMRKYPIGSVFASDDITAFRINFRDKADSDDITFEAEEESFKNKSPDEDLVEAVKGCWTSMQTKSIFSDSNSIHIVRTEVGKFLSSNSLMDSRKVKAAVLEQCGASKPKPLGGEMEGAGILKSYFVEEDGFNKWMVIKSICDWGEKKNSIHSNPAESERIKDSLQAFAMSNTCGAFENILFVLD